MKKFVAILMALCLLTAGAALAEAAPELNWSDFEATLESAGVTGDFWTFDDIAVKIWLPAELQPVELTEEDKEKGFISYFTDAEEKASVSLVYVDMSGISLEEYTEALNQTDGVDQVEIVVVNGLPAVSYTMPEQDSCHVAFTTEAGYILEVSMYPTSEEGADVVWGIVAASIQPE